MTRWVSVSALAVGIAAFAARASAQEGAAGARRWEATGFPGGGIVFTEGSDSGGEADFTDYAVGGSLTYNWNRFWGMEGEVGGAVGVEQRVGFGGRGSVGETTPPDMLAYNINGVYYPLKSDRRFVPYATGGIGFSARQN